MQKKKQGLALVLLALGSALFFYFSQAESELLTLYGNVDQRQLELAFIDAERIAEVLAEEGMLVQEGQVLARLETRRLHDRIAVLAAEQAAALAALTRLENGTRPEEIDQARAALAAEEAELHFARQQYERYLDIWQKSKGAALSKQDLDMTRLQLSVAQARLKQAQEQLRLAELGPRQEDIDEARARFTSSTNSLEEQRKRLADAELKSPAPAVIRSRLLEAGEMASPQRAVFSLALVSPKWIRAYVSETDLGQMRPGRTALISVDSQPGQQIPGTLGFISSLAEFTPKTVQSPDLRTSLVYEIRVFVEDSQDLLRLGMPATVVFP